MGRNRPLLKRFRDWIVYHVSRFLLLIGAYIPPSLGYAFGYLLGVLAYTFAGREKAKTMRNLRLGLGSELSEEQLRSIAKGMFVHYGRVAFEVMRLRRLRPERVRRMIRFEGLELVQKAIESGRGVIVATGHIGNWELMGAAVARLGIPVNVIARRLNDARLNELVNGLREKMGVRSILREAPESAKQILRCLKKGELLALLIDQDTKVEGAFVPFFGRPAYTPTGAVALAQRTGSLLVAASIQRLGPKKHIVRAVPYEIDTSSDREHVIIEGTVRITAQLESWIRERPEQWCWNHDRWRSEPEEIQAVEET